MKVDYSKIHQYRKQKKISIYELCNEIEIGRTTIWKCETGKSIPKEKHIRAIAKALNITVDNISDLKPELPLSDTELSKAASTWLELSESSSEDTDHNDFSNLNKIISRLKLKLNNAALIIRGLLNASQAQIYIYVKDKNLKYVIANDKFKKAFSLSKNYQFLGKQDKDFFNIKEAVENESEDKEVLITGIPVLKQERYMPGSRKSKWVTTSKLPIFDSNNNIEGILGSFYDITERKHNEILREQLAINLNNMSEGIIIYEINTFDILYVNKAVAEIHGYTLKEFSNKSKISIRKKYIHPEDFKIVQNYYKNRKWNKVIRYRIIRPDGETRWLETHHSKSNFMSKECIISVQLDITDQYKKIELNEIEKKSLKLTGNALIIVDYDSGKFLFSNEVFKEVFGHETAAFLNRKIEFFISSCIHPDDKKTLLSLIMLNKTIPEKFRCITQNGRIKELKNKSFNGKYRGKNCLVIISKDITDIKREL